MKILHIETGRHLYGGALQVLYLLQGLKSKWCRNILFCAQGSEISKAAYKKADVVEVPMAGEMDPRFLWRLLRLIRTEKPDIIHVHSRRGADLWGSVAAIFTRTPAILTRRVDNPEISWLARLKSRPFERIITISEGIRKVLLKEGIPENKVVCIHSAVDTDRYHCRCDKKWFRNEFGLYFAHKVIGVIAQLIPRKGHRFLIEAAPEILRHCPETRFICLGKGYLKDKLQQLCRNTGIADKVIFAGFRNDLERILPCLDLVIHPATMEGLGVSLLQAAASGIPIIASNVGGIPEIVRHNVNGYLFEEGSVCEIIEYSVALLKDPVKVKKFGKAGRNIVLTQFSINAMVDGNWKIYSQVLSKQSA